MQSQAQTPKLLDQEGWDLWEDGESWGCAAVPAARNPFLCLRRAGNKSTMTRIIKRSCGHDQFPRLRF